MTTARTPAHPSKAGRAAAPSPSRTPVRWLPARMQTDGWLRGFALASVVANVVIVVTGGAVRLTDSGLGCPTWPKCTDASLTPTKQYAIHGLIEFSNRQLTFVLALIAAITWLLAMAFRRQRRLATVALLGIPAQAVLGGLTVLTHLNPWLVALHFLLSMAIIAITFALWWRLRDDPPSVLRSRRRGLADARDGRRHRGRARPRNGRHRQRAARRRHRQQRQGAPHRAAGLLDGATARRRGDGADRSHRRAARPGVRAAGSRPKRVRSVATLLGVELAQGVIGYTQYFLHVPPLLVALHMLGACLVWIAVLRVELTFRWTRDIAVMDRQGACVPGAALVRYCAIAGVDLGHGVQFGRSGQSRVGGVIGVCS